MTVGWGFQFTFPPSIFTNIAATSKSHYSASLLLNDTTSNGTANRKSHFRHCCPQRSSFASPVWFPELLPCYNSQRQLTVIHYQIKLPLPPTKLWDRIEEAFCTGRCGPALYFGGFGLESLLKTGFCEAYWYAQSLRANAKTGPEIDHYRVLPQTHDCITRGRAATIHYTVSVVGSPVQYNKHQSVIFNSVS